MSLIFYKNNSKVADVKTKIRESGDDVYINFDTPVPLLCIMMILVDTKTPVFCTLQPWDNLEKGKGVKSNNNKVSCRFVDDEDFLKYVNSLIDGHNKNCSPKEAVPSPGPRNAYMKIMRSAFACSHEEKCEKDYVCCKKVVPRECGCPVVEENGAKFLLRKENKTPVERGKIFLNSLIYVDSISYKTLDKVVNGLNVNGVFVAGAIIGKNNEETIVPEIVSDEDFEKRTTSFDEFLKSEAGVEYEKSRVDQGNSSEEDVDSRVGKKRKITRASSDEEQNDDHEQETQVFKSKKQVAKPRQKVVRQESKVVKKAKIVKAKTDEDEPEAQPAKLKQKQAAKPKQKDVPIPKMKIDSSKQKQKLVAKPKQKIDPAKLVDDSETEGDEEDDAMNSTINDQDETGSDSDVMD